jgi:polysaccharide biosynthesis protein PslH
VLLWAGAEHLAFTKGFPPAVADRIDCMTLISWRSARRADRLGERVRILRDVVSYARYERSVVQRLARTIVAGEDDAAALRRIGRTGSVEVIPNGVAIVEHGASQQEGVVPLVVFSGTLDYPPNEDAARFFADSVWPDVLARVPTARFVIAGRRPTAEVVSLAERPGVEVRPDVADMRAVLRSAWVAVAPMRSGAGIKNKVLEAWAEGTPVVMTPMAANGLRLDSEARSLVGAEPADLADLVIRLLEHREERTRLGLAALELARREHSWRSAGDRLSAILDEAFLR